LLRFAIKIRAFFIEDVFYCALLRNDLLIDLSYLFIIIKNTKFTKIERSFFDSQWGKEKSPIARLRGGTFKSRFG